MPPPLASTDVRHVGDPIALVVAESRYVAEDACELIDVEFDASDPCVDFTTAAGDTERTSCTTSGASRRTRWSTYRSRRCPPTSTHVFASSAHVVEAVIDQNRYLCVPMETRGVVASWAVGRDEIDIVGVVPERPRDEELLRALPRDPGRQHPGPRRDVGGGFGQKMFVFREECAIVLASRLLGAHGQVDRGPAREPDRGRALPQRARQGPARHRRRPRNPGDHDRARRRRRRLPALPRGHRRRCSSPGRTRSRVSASRRRWSGPTRWARARTAARGCSRRRHARWRSTTPPASSASTRSSCGA